MIKRLFSLTVLIFLNFTLIINAQQKTGTIKGKITDADTKEPLVGANIILDSSNIGSYADIDGNYSLSKIPFGKYTLNILYVGYGKKTIGQIEIKSDTIIVVNASSYDGLSEEEAWEDINNGVIQIFLVGWPIYTKEQEKLSEKYGFKIASTGCFPMNTKRYDSVMVDYLKKGNGENWYEKFLDEWNNSK